MLSVIFTPEDADNYATVSRTVNINVAKATPLITWANPATIEQGIPLGATHLNALANAPGTLVYSPLAGTILPAGSGHYIQNATGRQSGASNRGHSKQVDAFAVCQ